jgi:phycoerythrin-associated linker protein
MDIQSFFQLSLGRWFVQRTSYNFVTQDSVVKTGEQSLEPLEKSDPQILQICREADIDSALAQNSFTATWKETTLGQPPQPQQSAILILTAHAAQFQRTQSGILLRSSPLLQSEYVLGNDQSLTLTQTTAKHQSLERIWFASSNLRLRTTCIQVGERCLLSSFCSEVRLGVKPEVAVAETITQSS